MTRRSSVITLHWVVVMLILTMIKRGRVYPVGVVVVCGCRRTLGQHHAGQRPDGQTRIETFAPAAPRLSVDAPHPSHSYGALNHCCRVPIAGAAAALSGCLGDAVGDAKRRHFSWAVPLLAAHRPVRQRAASDHAKTHAQMAVISGFTTYLPKRRTVLKTGHWAMVPLLVWFVLVTPDDVLPFGPTAFQIYSILALVFVAICLLWTADYLRCGLASRPGPKLPIWARYVHQGLHKYL